LEVTATFSLPRDEYAFLLIALACQPGERLLDLSGKAPRDMRVPDRVVSVEPFYAGIYIYEAGFPDTFRQCCSNKQTSVLQVRCELAGFAFGKAIPG